MEGHNSGENYGESQRYKGLVAQHNGHWGAQIYINNKRIWLGTFKSEIDAAIAYDRASIKLTSAPRNFSWTETMIQEANFQSLYSKETILGMIKDGSYQSKFDDFMRRRKKDSLIDNKDLNFVKGFSCWVLFEKELTPSDVGKLNRLVIPKKFAVRFFPNVPDESEALTDNEVHLSFYDTEKRLWKFRYCYWPSSQSFVFTKGWSQFVKEKKLMANDKISFYYLENLEVPNTGFWVIDTCLSSPSRNLGMNLDLGMEVKESLKDESTDQTRDIVQAKGFKLFGVQITE